jgi:hypothetical protein
MKHLALKTLAWSVALLALAGAWSLYSRPDFLVHLADQVWACF